MYPKIFKPLVYSVHSKHVQQFCSQNANFFTIILEIKYLKITLSAKTCLKFNTNLQFMLNFKPLFTLKFPFTLRKQVTKIY